jgi:hypothetical protein
MRDRMHAVGNVRARHRNMQYKGFDGYDFHDENVCLV